MAWYKPGRNPNHPGDPPPKWAPLSRRARLALLVTVIAGVVIALLIVATRSADATDGPGMTAIGRGAWLRSPTSGQRVEAPEAGVAVTFPNDWHVLRDRGYVWLWCTSLDESLGDDWLSIAWTIGILSEEA